ncbi:MAG: undecaprenyl-diphosphate phosphatase [Saprospiraceae bacterium]
MEVIKAIVLGIIQGLTEFLPVSSSGHLELAKYILGDESLGEESMLMTVILHFGTALATVFVFRQHILRIIKGIFTTSSNQERQFAGKIILSMIPAVVVGLFFEKEIETLFSQNIILVCSMLIVTGVLLFIADRSKVNDKDVSYIHAIIIGLAQAIAITPGISRSGATISTSVILGIDKSAAAEFSFLMVVPLIFGKIAKDILDGAFAVISGSVMEYLAGFLAAFVAGIIACTWMISLVRRSSLWYFSLYCFIVGIGGIVYASLNS